MAEPRNAGRSRKVIAAVIAVAMLLVAILVAWRLIDDDSTSRRSTKPPESTVATRATAPPTPPADPATVTLAATGDLGSSTKELMPVARQIDALQPEYVLALGDLVYPDGQVSGFSGFFTETWGPFLGRVIATPGNHDYHTPDARGFFDSFPQAEYFARDLRLNGWRIYVLNCEVDCGEGSAQSKFVADDIAAHPNRHRFAIVHRPRFTSSQHGDDDDLTEIWTTLAADGGEFMLAGHNHVYERFDSMTGTGTVSSDGMRQFVVGTGGNELYSFDDLHVGEQFRDNEHHGVLWMTLGADDYSWKFLATDGATIDAGTQATKQLRG
ncbi:MAG: metallophosphoesterase [Acidimicrobiia bacterium]|nr:metallophosphoesterase [Acidimicrobiia bacterium]